MLPVSKTDRCADRSILTLPSACKEYLETFKVMTSHVVQRALSLTDVYGSSDINGLKYKRHDAFQSIET